MESDSLERLNKTAHDVLSKHDLDKQCLTKSDEPHSMSEATNEKAPPFGGRASSQHPADFDQVIVTPPSTTMPWPVMNDPAFEASITATPAISSGSPMRPSGVVLL